MTESHKSASGELALSTVVMWLTWAAWLVLLLSGVFLTLFYRPTAAAAFDDIETLTSPVRVGEIVRWVHRLTSFLAIALALALVVSYLVEQRKKSAGFAAAATIGTLAASFTGYLLPWDQLALWAVTTGTNMMGFRLVFGDNVRFILAGGVEISPATFRAWFVVHVAVIPVVLVLLLWRARRAAG